MKATVTCLLAGLVCLAPWPVASEPQGSGEASQRLVEYYVQLHYRQALAYAKETLRLGEEELGPHHPTMAVLLDELGGRYRVLGRFAEAEPIYARALAIREKALGLEHPAVAASLESYAALLRELGRDSEATEMEARAGAIRVERVEQNR